MLNVKIFKKIKDAFPPVKTDKLSAGWDLKSRETISLSGIKSEGKRHHIFDTGIVVIPPSDYRIDIRARSSISIKHHIILLNSIGTIDSNYTGIDDTIKIGLMNIGDNDYQIERGDKIAQMLIIPDWQFDIEIINKISNNSRGGLGSSGR